MDEKELAYLIAQMFKIDLHNKIILEGSNLIVNIFGENFKLRFKKLK